MTDLTTLVDVLIRQGVINQQHSSISNVPPATRLHTQNPFVDWYSLSLSEFTESRNTTSSYRLTPQPPGQPPATTSTTTRTGTHRTTRTGTHSTQPPGHTTTKPPGQALIPHNHQDNHQDRHSFHTTTRTHNHQNHQDRHSFHTTTRTHNHQRTTRTGTHQRTTSSNHQDRHSFWHSFYARNRFTSMDEEL